MTKKCGAVASMAVAVLMVSNGAAFAEGGTAGSGSAAGDQAGMGAPAGTSESIRQEGGTAARPGMMERDVKADAAKMSLAPHSIAVETSLLSAIDQVRGLRAQVKTAQSQPTPEFMDQYRLHSREMKDSLKSARTHESQLKSSAAKFPSLAQSEQFRQIAPAISDVERLSAQWEKQTASPGYWRDVTKVSSDLDQLERRLSTALEKAKNFNSRIDASEIG